MSSLMKLSFPTLPLPLCHHKNYQGITLSTIPVVPRPEQTLPRHSSMTTTPPIVPSSTPPTQIPVLLSAPSDNRLGTQLPSSNLFT